MAELRVVSSNGGKYKATPALEYRNNMPRYYMDTVVSQGLAIGLSGISDKERFEISIKESSKMTPFIALKVLQFPFINLLWLGTILMFTGFMMSLVKRAKMLKESKDCTTVNFKKKRLRTMTR